MSEQQFVDADNYSPASNEKVSFRSIIMRHLQRIIELGSKEMRGGFWETRPSPVSNIPLRTYVPDSRAAYINAIKNLSHMLFAHFDEQMAKDEREILESVAKKRKALNEAAEENKYKSEAKDAYYPKLVLEDYEKLYRSLCTFLKRKKYLELGQVED